MHQVYNRGILTNSRRDLSQAELSFFYTLCSLTLYAAIDHGAFIYIPCLQKTVTQFRMHTFSTFLTHF